MLRTVLFTAVLLFVLSVSDSHAKIFRIGFGGKITGVDYDNFDANVMSAAAAGDTIQFYQYSNSGSSVNINKRLVLLGFGYMLDKNPGLQATPVADNTATLYFDTGSEGSIVRGMNIYNVYIAASNISISRCRVNNYLYLGYNGWTGQNRAVSNITVSGNYITGTVYDQRAATNLIVTNNIIPGYIYLDSASGSFTNNVITYAYNSLYLYSFLIKNNIFNSYYCISAPESIFQNNLFSIDSCAGVTGSGNKFSVDMTDVFVNWDYGNISADNQLALKTGSPASGAGLRNDGVTATDAGVFGGEPGYIYKLSGIPDIPAIYKLSAPSQNAVTNPYTINVSVRSNN